MIQTNKVQYAMQERNAEAINRIIKAKKNPQYDKALLKIAEAKDMLNKIYVMFPFSKAKRIIEVEPIELHLLDEIMHDFKGSCKDFTGKLELLSGTIIIKAK